MFGHGEVETLFLVWLDFKKIHLGSFFFHEKFSVGMVDDDRSIFESDLSREDLDQFFMHLSNGDVDSQNCKKVHHFSVHCLLHCDSVLVEADSSDGDGFGKVVSDVFTSDSDFVSIFKSD